MHLRRLFAITATIALLPLSAVTAQVPTLDPDVVPPAAQEAQGCDPLDPSLCLFPFPNNFFTRADPDSATGRLVDFGPAAMPRNGTDLTTGELGGEGKPVDPTEWNRNDGFSPGSMVMTHVPGLDLHQTWGTTDEDHSGRAAGTEPVINEPGYFDHRDHIADIGRYLDNDAPIVIVNAETGQRHPFWSELDLHPEATDDRRALILRPAVNFEEGATYVVGLRELRAADGSIIPAGPEFSALRNDGSTARGQHTRFLMGILAEFGFSTDEDLFLVWDFTVASAENLAGRLLHIRDDAFAQLGDTDLADGLVDGAAPAFSIDTVEERSDQWTDSRGRERTQALRRIEGSVTVPNYLDRPQQTILLDTPEGEFDLPVPGSRFLYGLDGVPLQNPLQPTVDVPFVCDVPTDSGANPGVMYGHGLLGTRNQIGAVAWPRRFGFAGCAMDFWGMSTNDLPTVAAILTDMSHFPALADRAQQGFLNWHILGRAMVHSDGLGSDPAFKDAAGGPLLVTAAPGERAELYYDGNSQGGIMGPPIIATSPDVSRGILGVPGMNYSTLLNRSVDWEPLYGEVYYATYQDPLERQLGFALIQMLWDRAEANGFAHHTTTDPYPNTPPHEVLLQVAWADHQVANVAAEVMGRTYGAPIMVPGLPDGRHWEAEPYFSATAEYPYSGSGLVYWDSGNATPPNGNLPPTHASDPHGHPRSEPASGWQEAHFLLTGQLGDVCLRGDYLTNDHPDNDGAASCIEPPFAPGTQLQPGPH